MLRLLFRFFGLLALAGAFAAMIIDGTRSVAAGTATVLPLGRAITHMVPDIFIRLRAIVEGRVPLLWDPVLVTILLMPTWLVLGAIGLALFALTRRRAPKIGYSRRD